MSFDLGRLLVPYLAETMPAVATVVPYLFALSVAVVIGSVVVATRIQDFIAKISEDEEQRSRRSQLLISLRSANQALKQARIVILVCTALMIVVWLAVWTRRDAPELTELVFVVLGVGIFVPLYFAVSTLSRVLGSAADLLTRKAEQE